MTGWISRKNGRFMFRFYTTRVSDGKKVEQMKTIGLISALKTEKAAWQEVERLGLTKLSSTPTAAQLTFDRLAKHFIEHELDKSEGKIGRKAEETSIRDKHLLNKYCVQRWGKTLALDIKPLELEAWFELLRASLKWTSISKVRSVMSQAFNHGYRHGLISGGKDSNPVKLSRCPVSTTCGKKYLRPAAVKAGVIPEDYKGRFGWHNMRHSLATFLAGEVDSSQTMKMLRHKKLSTTMELYTHSVGSKQCEVQQKYLSAIGLNLVTGKTTGNEGQKQTA